MNTQGLVWHITVRDPDETLDRRFTFPYDESEAALKCYKDALFWGFEATVRQALRVKEVVS